MNRKIKSMKEREIVMITIQGLYNTAVCYTPELEEAARKQIQTVCDQAEFAGCKIRIMPDVHAGKGCTIGTTMIIQDKIVPGMVGVDIGCGMETVELREREVDFEKLDALIRREIPYGREVRDIPHALNAEIDLTHLRCTDQVNLNRAMRSIGSLGGGNHFIEVDRAEDGRLFLVVHSGSRHLGTEVAEHYQNEGRRALWGGAQYQVQATIDQLKAEGRFQEIQKTICMGAPFYVLGPIVTDIAPGYDHITAAIGGAVAAMSGAAFLCYVTPAEHLALPNVDDVKQGIVASKIAAHAADIAKGIPHARDIDDKMGDARRVLDWDAQFACALDPETAKAIRDARLPEDDHSDTCSMCGKFCAVRSMNKALAGEYIDIL